ncbi:MAG: hypothetical protein JXR48_01325, partial [Candidatus Delongbacteria bacterium]|nr:hypothetical protein [Candidatus Delongbacteria bacterium]MBN2833585.1 hypothetical protein [Candidatus Delongbacteria bacterium]
TAAASVELSSQAERMKEAISVFKVKGHNYYHSEKKISRSPVRMSLQQNTQKMTTKNNFDSDDFGDF